MYTKGNDRELSTGMDADEELLQLGLVVKQNGEMMLTDEGRAQAAQAKAVFTARRGWGRVAIANSDAGWSAYAHAAIDQAYRAVGELPTA